MSCLEKFECKKHTIEYLLWMSFLGGADSYVDLCNSTEMRRGKTLFTVYIACQHALHADGDIVTISVSLSI